MRSIETKAMVDEHGNLTSRIFEDIPPGEYNVVLVLDLQKPLEKYPQPDHFPTVNVGDMPDDISPL